MKRLEKALLEHKKFLKKMGYRKTKLRFSNPFPDLSVSVSTPTSNNLHVSGGFKRSIDDYKWKKDQKETMHTISEIERKKTRIAPLYNKGPAAYITEKQDTISLGRKI